ncbi:DUF3939 domain-containing protein [Anaerocolumna xylanovorans]|uniref:Uncharacterized protein n=1 Tax=Anaerocolumna xylanovorans DSM 12503 TaxID=1121345 RepID=A0A1M7Y3K5_9FIRM|nr:DUF3939 domain-containing protein [Anaerocolumna xylanovorans]SHO46771.1 Protein of unknown function [Anaerocolumna xylanovorans DSM 12503]
MVDKYWIKVYNGKKTREINVVGYSFKDVNGKNHEITRDIIVDDMTDIQTGEVVGYVAKIDKKNIEISKEVYEILKERTKYTQNPLGSQMTPEEIEERIKSIPIDDEEQ